VTEKYHPVEEEEIWNVLRRLGLDEISGVLEFLQAKDLLNFTCTSKMTAELSGNDTLWKKLYAHDFSLGTMEWISLNFGDPKSQYMRRIEERKKRIGKASETEWMRSILNKLESRRDRVKRIMDLIHIRLMTPLLGISILCTIIFAALKLDGYVKWSIWAILAPIWLLFFVLFVASITGYILYYYRSNADSLFHNMFDNLRGVVWFFLQRVFEMDKRAIASGALSVLLVFFFVLLFALKLSVGSKMPWGLTFLPLWFTFVITSASPCLRPLTDCASYTFFMLFIWIPLLVFFALLSAKLSGSTLSLAVVFTPFWILDCLMMSGSFGVFAHQMWKWYRIGWREETSFGFVSLAFSACFLIPIFVFEVLLCLYDSGEPGLSAFGCFTPFLFCWGILTIILCVASCRYQTPFEELRNQGGNDPGNSLNFHRNGIENGGELGV